jgi:hypothetical protein
MKKKESIKIYIFFYKQKILLRDGRKYKEHSTYNKEWSIMDIHLTIHITRYQLKPNIKRGLHNYFKIQYNKLKNHS